MSNSVYQTLSLISTLLVAIVQGIPVGTDLNVACVLFALMSGRFLWSRGAVFPALADLGLSAPTVRRAEAALVGGRWTLAKLLANWQRLVVSQGRFQPHEYEGIRPVPCDLTGFFRPHLNGCTTKHYVSQANRALPALVFALVGSVGSVGSVRLAIPRLILRQGAQETSENLLMQRVLMQAADILAECEALVVDAGFSLAYLLSLCQKRAERSEPVMHFVARVDKNFTARRNELPAYKGRGRRPEHGEVVRPLARKYKEHALAATPADKQAHWKHKGKTVRAQLYENLVLPSVLPGAPACVCFRAVVIHDPRYKEPLILATNLSVSAKALWQLYRDRWPIEQLPLAAKQMLGAERAFVFGPEGRWRLPELALLAGNALAYLAAVSQPVASGFWDRCCRPTCGRMRRTLHRVHFSELPFQEGQLRKKQSPTEHLPKGIQAHRRHKTVSVTGN